MTKFIVVSIRLPMHRFALLLVAAAFLSACQNEEPAESNLTATSIPFDIQGTLHFIRNSDTLRTIDIEFADSDSLRTRGLMDRHEIPDDTGMLFIFPATRPAGVGFWMKDTPRSLDILFFGPDSSLINIARNTTPYSTQNLPAEGPHRFVVEVPAGFTLRYGITPGTKIDWTRTGERETPSISDPGQVAETP